MSADTYPISQVEGFVERIDELEAEAKQFKEAIVKAVGSMDRASNAIDGLSQRITEMESEAKMIRDVEAWSTSRIVVIRRQIGVFLAQDFQSGVILHLKPGSSTSYLQFPFCVLAKASLFCPCKIFVQNSL